MEKRVQISVKDVGPIPPLCSRSIVTKAALSSVGLANERSQSVLIRRHTYKSDSLVSRRSYIVLLEVRFSGKVIPKHPAFFRIPWLGGLPFFRSLVEPSIQPDRIRRIFPSANKGRRRTERRKGRSFVKTHPIPPHREIFSNKEQETWS